MYFGPTEPTPPRDNWFVNGPVIFVTTSFSAGSNGTVTTSFRSTRTAEEIELDRILEKFREAARRHEFMRESRLLGRDNSPRPRPRPNSYSGPTSQDRSWMVHRRRNQSRRSPALSKPPMTFR